MELVTFADDLLAQVMSKTHLESIDSPLAFGDRSLPALSSTELPCERLPTHKTCSEITMRLRISELLKNAAPFGANPFGSPGPPGGPALRCTGERRSQANT
jgi:hypothetical protein